VDEVIQGLKQVMVVEQLMIEENWMEKNLDEKVTMLDQNYSN
jgi:hypothetical protein